MVQLNIAQFQKNKNQLNNVKLISFQEMLGTGMSHAGMQLHASRFAEILGMGMSQAGMRLHASRFAEMLGMGMSQARMQLHASRFAEMLGLRVLGAPPPPP